MERKKSRLFFYSFYPISGKLCDDIVTRGEISIFTSLCDFPNIRNLMALSKFSQHMPIWKEKQNFSNAVCNRFKKISIYDHGDIQPLFFLKIGKWSGT